MILEVMQIGKKAVIISDSRAVACLDGTTDDAVRWIHKNLKNIEIKIRQTTNLYQK